MSTEQFEARRLGVNVGHIDVEVHPILDLLLLGHLLQQQLGSAGFGRQEERYWPAAPKHS
jgi:hypothetical protein